MCVCVKLVASWLLLHVCFLLLSVNFFRINFLKKIFHEQHQSVKKFGPRSVPALVWPDLGPNYLLRLAAVDKITASGERGNQKCSNCRTLMG